MDKDTNITRFSHTKKYINLRRYNAKSVRIHWHSFYELEIIISGKGKQFINGAECSYSTHDAFLLGPTDFHEISLENEAEVWLLQVPPHLMPQDFHTGMLSASLPIMTHLSDENFNTINELLTLLKNNVDKDEKQNHDLTISAMHTILLYFLSIEEKNVGKPSNERLGKIYQYLQDNFQNDLTLDDIAKHFALNKNYLCTYFKKATGKTIVDCLREMRLLHASHLAVISKKTTQEICERCGYNSVSHFLRDFKKRFNMSPMEMRKKSN